MSAEILATRFAMTVTVCSQSFEHNICELPTTT